MAPSLFGRFLGNTVSGAAGMAIGGAVRPTLDPLTQEVANETWPLFAIVPPDPYYLAAGVAQGQVGKKAAYDWAAETGYGKDQMDALVAVANNGPALGYAYSAWRRGRLSDDEFKTALKRQAIEDQWIDALMALKQELLDPVQLANAIHRGLIPDPGLLAVPPPTGTGNVPAYPVYDIDALREARGSGIDRDRLGALVGLTGLPMGPHEAANAVFRRILTDTDYERAIAEGNTRNEWGDAIFEQSRQIPTARDFLENALRGYRTLPQAIRGAELHGMTPEHATLIYQNQGRPMNVHQITQALARGAKFNPEPGEIKDPYDASIVEGNLKPAYYEMAKSLRYTLPSTFVMRALTEAGTWTEEKARTRLEWAGWYPPDAAEAAKAWAADNGSGVSPAVKSEQGRLRTATHRSYVARESDDAAATAALEAAGVPTADIAAILAIWQAERGLIRAQLSPSDVRKAYRKGTTNAATGNKWTRDEALAALIDRGWGVVNANDYLDI